MNKVLIIVFSFFHCLVFAQKNDSIMIKNQLKIEELKKRLSQLEGGKALSVTNCAEENVKLKLALKQYEDSVTKLNKYFNSNPNLNVSERIKTAVYSNFDASATSTNYDGNRQLDSIINIFKSGNNYKIKLVGHADKSGQENKNLALSKERAENLKLFLINKKNISADKIITEWYGSSMPAVKDATSTNSLKNRRVEVYLIH